MKNNNNFASIEEILKEIKTYRVDGHIRRYKGVDFTLFNIPIRERLGWSGASRPWGFGMGSGEFLQRGEGSVAEQRIVRQTSAFCGKSIDR